MALIVTDAHGSNDLTNNGGTGVTTGLVGSCANADGSDDYLYIADNADFRVGGSAFTFAAWFSPANTSHVDAYFSKFNGSNGSYVLYQSEWSANKLTWIVGNDQGSLIRLESALQLTSATWGFVAAGYVRGAQVGDIAGVSDTAPIEITSTGHGLTTGDTIGIAGVSGTSAADGTWTVTVTGTDTFTLDGSTGDTPGSGGRFTTRYIWLSVDNSARDIKWFYYDTDDDANTFKIFLDQSGSNHFTGKCDQFGFWKVALSDGQLTSLYNSGAGRDYASLSGLGLTTDLISFYEFEDDAPPASSSRLALLGVG